MIYIDPPYNTGNDFIYEDDFAENTAGYLQRSNQKDESGNRLTANPESNGRFHSDWLSMMYPRLKLARNLLSDDGVIFISIDDNEQANLKRLCDEVFGEDNFLASLVWRTDGNFDNQAKFKNCHEHIIVYGRNEETFPAPPVIDPSTPKNSKLFKAEIRNTIVKNGFKNPVSNVTLPVGFPAEINDGVIAKRENSYPHYKNDAIISSGKLTNITVISSGWSSKDLLNEFIENKCESILDAKGQEN
jgi:adenine-specific DNA-methyltransferase